MRSPARKALQVVEYSDSRSKASQSGSPSTRKSTEADCLFSMGPAAWTQGVLVNSCGSVRGYLLQGASHGARGARKRKRLRATNSKASQQDSVAESTEVVMPYLPRGKVGRNPFVSKNNPPPYSQASFALRGA